MPLFNGINRILPGAYTRTDASGLISTTLAPGGITAIVGTAGGGEPGKVYRFNDSGTAKSTLKNGDLLDALNGAWQNGAKVQYAVRIGNALKATKTLSNAATGGSVIGTIQSKDWGSLNNNISIKVGTGTNFGFNFTVLYTEGSRVTTELYEDVVDLGELAVSLTDSSSYVELTSFASSGIPYINNLTVALTGGDDGLTTILSDWTDALDSLKVYDVQLLHPANVSDALVHSAFLQHCIEMSDAQKFRIAIVGGGVTQNVGDANNPGSDPTSHIGRAYSLNHERIIYVGSGVNGLKAAYTASLITGKLAGFDSATSLTFKSLTGVTSLNQQYSQTEKEDLITRGVIVIEDAPNGRRVIRDVTTRQDNLLGISEDPFKDITTVRIADYVNLNVKNILEATYVGKKGTTSAISSMKNTTASILGKLIEGEIITNFRNVTVTQNVDNPKVFEVVYEIVPVFTITWVFITTRLSNS